MSYDPLLPFKKCPGYTKSTLGEDISLEYIFETNLAIFQNEGSVTITCQWSECMNKWKYPLPTLIIQFYDLNWHEIKKKAE